MIRGRTLVLSGAEHRRLKDHLFPGDGKEAAAILLCTRVATTDVKLLVREALLVPYEQCIRARDNLTWPGEYLDIGLERAEVDDLSLVLLHSHPGGLYDFSLLDDESDNDVMPSLFWARSPEKGQQPPWHGSAIMVPGGAIKARFYDANMHACPVDLVAVYGDDVLFYWGDDLAPRRRPTAFTDAMTDELGRLSVAVVGVSGTGSVVAEQLLRIGVGELVLIDDDHVEVKNLNRILNSTQDAAARKVKKVALLADAAARVRSDLRTVAVPLTVGTVASILAAAEADIVFCCVDSGTGRHICDRLASAMLQPLFDVGVAIPVRTPAGGMAISNICGRIDYVRPGGPTLLDRRVYTPDTLAAEDLRNSDPEAYAQRVRDGYMPGAGQEAPSVITVNMRAASMVVQELIARAYPYRVGGNSEHARTEFDLVAGEEERTSEGFFKRQPTDWAARGLQAPLLGLPALEDTRCG